MACEGSYAVPAVRILVVDDNPGFLHAIAEMLREEFLIVGTLSNGIDVADKVAELRPDVIVLDISLGNISGFEVARRLKATNSNAKVVFFPVHERVEFVSAAAALGASGYVFKSQGDSELRKAIVAAYGGEKCFPVVQR